MIHKLRKAQGFTRDELAAKIHVAGWDVTAEIVKQIERGQREVNDIELRVLAGTLRVPIAVLLDQSTPPLK
jgi:transcriptional regulator with XRE-family HTH domain